MRENRAVAVSRQVAAARRLFVHPARRQLRGAFDGIDGDCAIADNRTGNGESPGAEGLNQPIEVFAQNDTVRSGRLTLPLHKRATEQANAQPLNYCKRKTYRRSAVFSWVMRHITMGEVARECVSSAAIRAGGEKLLSPKPDFLGRSDRASALLP